MSTLAKAVHRGDNGSVHYLWSNPDGSTLVITDPKLGKILLRFDGPCRLLRRDGDSVDYESIGATGSNMVMTRPGMEPLINSLGLRTSCMDGPHDYDLWPVCPSGNRHKKSAEDKPVDMPEPLFASLRFQTPCRSPALRLAQAPIRRMAQYRQGLKMRRTAQMCVGLTLSPPPHRRNRSPLPRPVGVLVPVRIGDDGRA
jgi:hypothetical protein